MLGPLRRYLAAPALSEPAAAAVLRAAFAVAFMGQVLFAALVGVSVRLLASGTTPRPGGYLAWVLVGFALVESLVAAVLSARPLPGGGRRAALSGTLLIGTLLGSVAWFLALALATEQRGAPLYVLLMLLSLGYAGGFLAVSRLARTAAKEVVRQPGSGA